jgi:tetratricopeptide (TPR) repeat protein
VIAGLMGRQSWADWYSRRAMAMAQQQSHYVAAAYVCHIQALLEAQRGNWLGAKASNLQTMSLIQEIGDYNLEAEAWVVRATVYLAEGNFADAPQAWANARRLATRNGNQQILCWSYLDEVDTANGVGDVEAAQAALTLALAIPTPPTDGGTLIDKARACAMTRLRQRRYLEAIAAADEVIAHVSRQPPTGYHWADFSASAVEVYLRSLAAPIGAELDRDQSLTPKARQGVKIVQRLAKIFWNVRPRALLLAGLLEAQENRRDDAVATLRRAQKMALDMRMPYEEARALVEIAEITPETPRPAETERAITLFAKLGAEFEKRRALTIQSSATHGSDNSAITQLATR